MYEFTNIFNCRAKKYDPNYLDKLLLILTLILSTSQINKEMKNAIRYYPNLIVYERCAVNYAINILIKKSHSTNQVAFNYELKMNGEILNGHALTQCKHDIH